MAVGKVAADARVLDDAFKVGVELLDSGDDLTIVIVSAGNILLEGVELGDEGAEALLVLDGLVPQLLLVVVGALLQPLLDVGGGGVDRLPYLPLVALELGDALGNGVFQADDQLPGVLGIDVRRLAFPVRLVLVQRLLLPLLLGGRRR